MSVCSNVLKGGRVSARRSPAVLVVMFTSVVLIACGAGPSPTETLAARLAHGESQAANLGASLRLATGSALNAAHGVSGAEDGSAIAGRVRAAAVAPLTASQLLDWVQLVAPSLFPPGAANQTLQVAGSSYTLRTYASTGNYLAVGGTDNTVYGLGTFTNQALLSFGKLADFTCDVQGGCAVFSPDANGNLGAGVLMASAVNLRAGNSLSFQKLGPLDAIIEVASPTLTSAQLCQDVSLPAGAARVVPQPKPLPVSHHAGNEISGPFRTYPAGMFPLSSGTDVCGFVERTAPCPAPNESVAASQSNAAGGTDYLCAVSPILLNPADPTKASTNPPTPNPACARGKVLDATWADPAVQGVFIRLSWNDINPAYGVYDWSALDRELVAALRNGKVATLGVRVGGNSIPDWVFTQGDPQWGKARKLLLRDWGTNSDAVPNTNCGFEYAVASPSDAAFKGLFKKMLADLGAHVRSDQRFYSVLAGVKVTGMGMATLENRLPSRCNVAVRNPALGDVGTQGHIIALQSSSLSSPVFDAKYNLASDPSLGRVRDTSLCVCNPQVLQGGGYTPSALQAFYSEVQAALLDQFGHKQQIYMDIAAGFPQIGETGRFLGDHLVPPITSMSTGANGQLTMTYGTVRSSPAVAPTDIPNRDDTTEAVIANARTAAYAGGALDAARAFGVENAALDVIGFALLPNQGTRCTQQAAIDTTGVFAGAAAFPLARTARIDATGAKCPETIAVREGVAFDKVTGFQVVAGIGGATELDSALWNMTLNTNGLFFELYEQDAWLARKQSALNAGAVWNANPAVRSETATVQFASAAAKSGAAWNTLLLERAKVFSADATRANLFQAYPFPDNYSLTLTASPATARYFFNARACKAYATSAVPVRINTLNLIP